jgi:hypothetical protein
VISRRINPYSPNSHLIGFCSQTELSPSDLLKVSIHNSSEIAKTFCVILNSIIFIGQFFLLKEETTGRYVDIRLYDLDQMLILPNDKKIKKLCNIFDKYSSQDFPSLREQLDIEFEDRYNSFWLKIRKKQRTLFDINEIVRQSQIRINFDRSVCDALMLNLSEAEIIRLYTINVNEMIITRGLSRDKVARFLLN